MTAKEKTMEQMKPVAPYGMKKVEYARMVEAMQARYGVGQSGDGLFARLKKRFR